MPINILSQETINKIAAGEVIERPQNAVKELTENSIDACANSINIEIEQAGRKLIRVSDNGIGMDKKDLEISILRHSTSKILNFEDLSYLQSMGFRGEALSSIAAISKLEIKTKKKDVDNGWKLLSEGGKNIKIMPWDGAKGSIFEVKDLFFNTPARQKFLKSDIAEKGRIINTIEETALANNDIAFKLISDSRLVFQSPISDKKNRISDILGKDFAANLKNAKLDERGAAFDIYYTGRNNSQPNRKYQYLFVNSRPVNIPKWLFHCINRIYQENIERGRYPGFLIYIIINPADIDINVSPTKREIKFADENILYAIIESVIKSGLENNFPSINISEKSIGGGTENTYLNAQINLDKKHFSNPMSKYLDNKNFNYKAAVSPAKYRPQEYEKVYKSSDFSNAEFSSSINVIGQIFETFILAQKEDDFYIFDQHAAAERVTYEQFQNQIKSNTLNIQSLLMPETFELPSSQISLLKENLQILNEIGISIEEFGDKTFRISAYPALLGDIKITSLIEWLFEDLEIKKNIEINSDIAKRRDKIIRAACRQSIKAGHTITFTEGKHLIEALFKCSQPFTCPHGRPTAYIMSKADIWKYFKR